MKSKYTILTSILVFLFLIPIISNFSDNIQFIPKLSSAYNVELISESEFSTRWDFVNETAGYNTLFYEPFDNTSSYWDLYGVTNRYIIHTDNTTYLGDNSTHGYTSESGIVRPNGDVLTEWSSTPTGNHYSCVDEEIQSSSDFVSTSGNYQQDIFAFTTIDLSGYENRSIYGVKAYFYGWRDNAGGQSTGIGTSEVSMPTSYISLGLSPQWRSVSWTGLNLTQSDLDDLQIGIDSRYLGGGNYLEISMIYCEIFFYGNSSYNISKNYQGSGYLYCQTNKTETLTLRSPNNLNLELQEGDKIEVVFNTTSANRIDFNLRNESVQKASYILSAQGNDDFSTRTKTFSITSNMSVDQMEFTGTFADTKNLIVDSVRVLRPYGDVISYNLEPYGRRELNYSYPYNYDVEVYERGVLVETFDLTTSSQVQTLIYQRIVSEIVYITFYDENNEHLAFQNYITYVNYTLDNFSYTNKRLSNNIMYVDEDSLIKFNIYDSFDVLIKSYQSYEETFIDITLNIYSLKIKNEASEFVNYTLKNQASDVVKSGNILSEEVIEFSIASGTYQLNYTNNEESENNYPLHSESFELTSNKIIVVNTSYHQPYIGLFTYDGLGLNHDLTRLYINEERRDYGFNTIRTTVADFLVLDYFNNTLANETSISMEGLTEYNLYVEVYTLNILNNFDIADLVVNISQESSGIWMSQIIPSEFALSYRFIPNLNYTIVATFDNGTLYESRTVNLTQNSQIESFGLRTQTPEFPKDVYFSVYSSTGIGIENEKLKFYIDSDRADFGFNTVDHAIVNLKVEDFLGTELFNSNVNVSGIYEYDISVNLYNLKLKNSASEKVNFTIDLSGTIISDVLVPEEILTYQLSPNTYELNYTNQENNELTSLSINLNENKEVVINTIYQEVYFGIYSSSGITIERTNFKFYIDGNRTDFGFNIVNDTIVNLKVYDYMNTKLFDQDINVSEINEYDLEISIFNLKISNMASENANISILLGGESILNTLVPEELSIYQLSSANYTLLITNQENSQLTNLTINLDQNRNIVINTTYKTVYFAPFLANGLGFNHESTKFYINGSRKDYGFNVLTSYTVYLQVKDFFDQSVFDQVVDVSTINEYSMFLDLESLKMKNKGSELMNFSLSIGATIETNNILPDEIIEYYLVSGTYELNYTNHENMETYNLSISLSENRFIEFNTSYYDIYFGLFNFDGLGLDHDLFRFYINNERKDFGFNTLKYDSVNLKVLDYFNEILFNQEVNLRQFTEYNIFVEVYNLIMFNNYSFGIYVEIERNDITIKQTISSQSSISYRFLPLVEYEIKWYYLNGTQIDRESVELEENNQIVSFGFYSAEVPIVPTPDFTNIISQWAIFLLFIMLIIVLFLVLWLVVRGKVRKHKSKKKAKKSGKRQVAERNNKYRKVGIDPNEFKKDFYESMK